MQCASSTRLMKSASAPAVAGETVQVLVGRWRQQMALVVAVAGARDLVQSFSAQALADPTETVDAASHAPDGHLEGLPWLRAMRQRAQRRAGGLAGCCSQAVSR